MAEHPILFSGEERWVKCAASRIGVTAKDYIDALNTGKKICGGCKLAVPRDEQHFGRCSKTFDRFQSRCRVCIAAQKKEHYARTKPQQRARQLRYQQENRPRLYEYNARWQRDRNAKLRAEMIEAYGAKCACCGESEPLFLDLDHIHNDGADHRREFGRDRIAILQSLREQGWPRDNVQLLCCNCNQGKARNGGICPHHTKNLS
jgi:hypothetical protein